MPRSNLIGPATMRLVDLLGQWRTIRATLPYVIERRGHILVVASIYAFFNGVLNS